MKAVQRTLAAMIALAIIGGMLVSYSRHRATVPVRGVDGGTVGAIGSGTDGATVDPSTLHLATRQGATYATTVRATWDTADRSSRRMVSIEVSLSPGPTSSQLRELRRSAEIVDGHGVTYAPIGVDATDLGSTMFTFVLPEMREASFVTAIDARFRHATGTWWID